MVTWENYEEYMLLYADNELNEAELKALMAFVEEHPELKKELNAYAATKLIPDEGLVFENKDILLKKGGSNSIALNRWYYYAAAAAILFFAVFIIDRKEASNDNATPIVKTESKTIQPVTGDSAGKDLHSIPVNPVATETTIADNKPVKKETIKQPAPVKKALEAPTPLPQKPKDTYVAQETPKKQETPIASPVESKPILAQNNQPDIKTETPLVASEQNETATTTNERKGFLAWLPIRKEKKEGVTALADAVNDKLEKVKKLKNNLKDADVTVKIGKTELFVVRL